MVDYAVATRPDRPVARDASDATVALPRVALALAPLVLLLSVASQANRRARYAQPPLSAGSEAARAARTGDVREGWRGMRDRRMTDNRTDSADRTKTTSTTNQQQRARQRRALRPLPPPPVARASGYGLSPAYLRRLGVWLEDTRIAWHETRAYVERMLQADNISRSRRAVRDIEALKNLSDDADTSHVIIHWPVLRWLALHYGATLDALDAYCAGLIESPTRDALRHAPSPAANTPPPLAAGMSREARELVERVARLTPDQILMTANFAEWIADRDLRLGGGAVYIPQLPAITPPPLADRIQTEDTIERLRAADAAEQARARRDTQSGPDGRAARANGA